MVVPLMWSLTRKSHNGELDLILDLAPNMPFSKHIHAIYIYIYIYIYIVESNFKANSVSSSGKKSETKGKVFHYFIIIESNDKKQFYGMSRPIT